MVFSSMRALGVALAIVSCAGAMEFSVDDQASIKNAAKIVAGEMTSYYTSSANENGDIPGLLPEPYFWYEAGDMFNSLINYWRYTGDEQYNDITREAMLFQVGNDDSYLPVNQSRQLGNDDQAYWAHAAMTAAESQFPESQDANATKWIDLATNVFNTQYVRWDNESCGGGLRWQIFSFNDGYNYKNSASNGAFFALASRLARYTKNETYSQWAETAWDWSEQVGLLAQGEDDKSDHTYVYDRTDTREDCSDITGSQWTVYAGLYTLGAAYMYNTTSSDEWRNRLQHLINGLNVFYPNDDNVMSEIACADECDIDQKGYKGGLGRTLGYVYQLAPSLGDTLLPRMQTTAKAAAVSCSDGEGQSCSWDWADKGGEKTYGVSEQLSALEVIQSVLAVNGAAPGTEDGPGAGGNGGQGPEDGPEGVVNSAGNSTDNAPGTGAGVRNGSSMFATLGLSILLAAWSMFL